LPFEWAAAVAAATAAAFAASISCLMRCSFSSLAVLKYQKKKKTLKFLKIKKK
jgi:hypothetical protein